jgi:glycine/D-amino acid oxidase-like deaminating enzyme
MTYDFIIVGGGFAGLFWAYMLRKEHPQFSVVILEQDEYFGGRAREAPFGPLTAVPTGAGVGRYRKDRLLRALMTELDLPIETFPVRHRYSPRVPFVDVDSLFEQLRRANPERVSFRTWAIQTWGKELYSNFLIYNGYRDMEHEDVAETQRHYQIQDNYTKWTGFRVPWNLLIRRLCLRIGRAHLRAKQTVTAIVRVRSERFTVHTIDRQYTCRTVILACPIPEVLRLLPDHSSVYRGIGVQPFLRSYAEFDAPSAAILRASLPGTTVVSNVLQKIIPMDAERGVYMIAYSDNANAFRGKELTAREIVALVREEFGIAHPLRIRQLQHFYRPIGTHYYTPLAPTFPSRSAFRRVAQHPEPHIFVIGESVSVNQGWVEGALQSARDVYMRIFA